VVFFKVHTNYKHDSHYTKGLELLHQYTVKEKLPLRIWCDQSRHDELIKLKWVYNANNIQLVVFKCPGYMQGDFHEGLFGSIVRFIAMSQPGKHFIMDIDLKIRFIPLLNNMKALIESKYKFDYLYHIDDYKLDNSPDSIVPYVYAGF
jgi:hypothetical protein